MAAPTHYFRTIHSSFAAHSPSPWGSHNILADLGGLINQYPPGLGFGPQEVHRPVARRRPPPGLSLELPASPKQTIILAPPSRSSYTKFDPFADENAIETVHTIPRSSPSPSNTQYLSHNKGLSSPLSPPLSLSSTKSHPSQVMPRSTAINAWPPSSSNRSAGGGGSTAVSATTPHSNALNTRNARARLVAGILLNRVHAVGKPMRRRYFAGEPREYVKSRLSSVITAEA